MIGKVKAGDRFGRWRVVARAQNSHGNRRWLCRCDCGTERVVWQLSLLTKARGRTSRSCGCLQREVVAMVATKHGLYQSSEYSVWAKMLHRCTVPNSSSFKRYGGRGIRVCDRWSEFPNFYADMGPRPSTDHSLDRINNDGPYAPDNCRWATRSEQCQNTSISVRVTWNGATRTIYDWSIITGIRPRTIAGRIKRGWTPEEALTTPLSNKGGNRFKKAA